MNGAKLYTEAMGYIYRCIGRGAFRLGRSGSGSSRGRNGSENVGLSSENIGENPMPRNPKGSSGRLVHGGLVGT